MIVTRFILDSKFITTSLINKLILVSCFKLSFIASKPTQMASFDLQAAEQAAYAPFFGYMGAASAQIFTVFGAAYGTAKSAVGICSMGVMRPELIMKSVIPGMYSV